MNTLTLKRFNKTVIKLEINYMRNTYPSQNQGHCFRHYYMYMNKALRKRLVIQTYIALRFADHYNRI